MELRCAWVTRDPEYIEYHDKQWGRPVYDARELFAKLCLDGQQAGLSWITILKRTESYHRAYADFDPVRIVQFDDQDVERLMQDTGIIRNRLKVQSIIKNARAYLALEAEGIDFVSICGASWAAPPWSTSVRATATFRRPRRSRMPCPRPSRSAASPSSAAPSAMPSCRRWAW